MKELPTRHLVTGYAVGALITFVVAFGIALVLDAEAIIALAVGAFVGAVVGGPVGFLVAGQRARQRS